MLQLGRSLGQSTRTCCLALEVDVLARLRGNVKCHEALVPRLAAGTVLNSDGLKLGVRLVPQLPQVHGAALYWHLNGADVLTTPLDVHSCCGVRCSRWTPVEITRCISSSAPSSNHQVKVHHVKKVG